MTVRVWKLLTRPYWNKLFAGLGYGKETVEEVLDAYCRFWSQRDAMLLVRKLYESLNSVDKWRAYSKRIRNFKIVGWLCLLVPAIIGGVIYWINPTLLNLLLGFLISVIGSVLGSKVHGYLVLRRDPDFAAVLNIESLAELLLACYHTGTCISRDDARELLEKALERECAKANIPVDEIKKAINNVFQQ